MALVLDQQSYFRRRSGPGRASASARPARVISGASCSSENGGIESARRGQALASAGEHFAVDGHDGLAGHGAAGEELDDLLLEKAAAFLDDDNVLDLVRERIDQRRIERVGDAELEQREGVREAELLQRVFEV